MTTLGGADQRSTVDSSVVTGVAGGWAAARVAFAGVATPAALVHPAQVANVFTRAEQVRSISGRTIAHWAGRLAAKYAVVALLGGDTCGAGQLGEAEVLPRPTAACRRSAACLDGHPPAVRLRGSLAALAAARGVAEIQISVTHAAGVAVAVAHTTCPDTDVSG
jgi:phosphopantetheinyl transferase (holo-ACP synthase)